MHDPSIRVWVGQEGAGAAAGAEGEAEDGAGFFFGGGRGVWQCLGRVVTADPSHTQPTNQPANQPTSQPANQPPENQPINPLPISLLIYQPTNTGQHAGPPCRHPAAVTHCSATRWGGPQVGATAAGQDQGQVRREVEGEGEAGG